MSNLVVAHTLKFEIECKMLVLDRLQISMRRIPDKSNPISGRRIKAKGKDQTAESGCGEKEYYPTKAYTQKKIPLDILNSTNESHTSDRTNNALRRGYRDFNEGSCHHHKGGRKLSDKSTRRRQFSELVTEGLHHSVSVQEKTQDNSEASIG